jgi:hypothetical protein
VARRVDARECRNVVSMIINATHPDGYLYSNEPAIVDLLRRAVLCIDWQRKRIEKLQEASK